MRSCTLLLIAALLASSTGCKWIEDMKQGAQPRPKQTGAIPEVSADQLVNFLNDRAEKLRTLEYNDTRMRVSGKGIPVPATLDGSLAAAGPRYFRMVSSGRVAAAKLDMGSNPQEFWVYVNAPGDEPMYVFASHSDFESGKARMPGGIPFEPEWVMQALGMVQFPSTNQYAVSVNDRDRSYLLSWTAPTPGGGSVRKEIVFDADPATGSRPQVKKHILRTARTNALIATAEIKSAQTERVGVVRGTELPAAIQYPTHIVLKWEDPRFEMDLNLDKAVVNQSMTDDPSRRGYFAKPDIKGAKPIDLARYDFR
ncbi:MAG: hypothetical protein U0791_22955 [Gemmataceae bacterium]